MGRKIFPKKSRDIVPLSLNFMVLKSMYFKHMNRHYPTYNKSGQLLSITYDASTILEMKRNRKHWNKYQFNLFVDNIKNSLEITFFLFLSMLYKLRTIEYMLTLVVSYTKLPLRDLALFYIGALINNFNFFLVKWQ